MLWFVGLGTSGAGSIPPAALDAVSRAGTVYLESFTSPVPADAAGAVARAAGGRLVRARRWQVEDGREILGRAREGGAALVSYGDPFVATTHVELRTRAAREGIPTRAVHAASALTAAVGECGLHHYKVGGAATVMRDGSQETPCRAIRRTVSWGSHTVLPLEYDEEGGLFLDPGGALERLREGGVAGSTYCVVASRVGAADQGLVAGRASSLAGADFGGPPHTLIVPGGLHFTESDAVAASCRCLDPPAGNRDDGEPARMVARYVPMVREALAEVRPLFEGRPGYAAVLENAELYARDAEAFLADGRGEVAVLSVGYADGLVDALRMAAGLEPKT